ncbi:uncharacterized protein FOMMEDRAFT_100058, partial [Fomitiporia mediterranea MF3/22]
SDSFSSNIGILTGDPASPHLWNIFFSDLYIPSHPADISLNNSYISHLEQADNIVIFSTSPTTLQIKLNNIISWCSKNFLQINHSKTVAQVFGNTTIKPTFSIDSNILNYVDKFLYLGIIFDSSQNNIFHSHYSNKASKARSITHTILALESHISIIPPKQGIQLYFARIDPHLIYTCESTPDTNKKCLFLLQSVQHTFLRRLLGLNPRSLLTPLFTETGLLPIQFRQTILVLNYLIYLLQLPPSHFAFFALQESIQLYNNKHYSWYGDLLINLSNTTSDNTLQIPNLHTSHKIVSQFIKTVKKSCYNTLNNSLLSSTQTTLIKDRHEFNKKNQPILKIIHFRHYLGVTIPEHRIAFTRLLLSDYILALVQLARTTSNRHGSIPQHKRLCRFNCNKIEDPIYTLFQCQNSEISKLRQDFLLCTPSPPPLLEEDYYLALFS